VTAAPGEGCPHASARRLAGRGRSSSAVSPRSSSPWPGERAVLFVVLDAMLAALDSGNGDFLEYDALDAVGVVASMHGDHGQMRLRITVD
jgi:hypothetical protein